MPSVSPTLSFIVLGSDSQVGSAMLQLLDERSIPYAAIETSQCFQPEALKTFLEQGDHRRFVLNSLYDESPDIAPDYLKNLQRASATIAQSCADNMQDLMHMSSGHVFSGQSNRPYVETDEPDATTELGRVLREIETSVSETHSQSIFLRSVWLFSEQKNNFLRRLVNAAIRQETLSFSGSLKGCPTDAHALAKVFLAIAEQLDCNVLEPELWGVYHYGDSDACSMHTFAKTVITVVKSMAEVRVETIAESNVTDAESDSIENYELSCKKILSTFGIKQRPWRRSVHEVLKKTLTEDTHQAIATN